MPEFRFSPQGSDEVHAARRIARKVKGLAEIECPYCRAKGMPGIDPGEPILGGQTKPDLCASCDLHGVVWRLNKSVKTFTARQVIERWGPSA